MGEDELPALRTVSLVLASGPGFPGGSADRRYELSLLLGPSGHLDSALWYKDPRPWPARRFWPGEAPREGDIIFDPDSGWSMRFFPRPGEAADAPLHGLIRTIPILRPGEYVTIAEPDGAEYGYRIVSVR